MDKKERYWIEYYRSNVKEYGYNLDSGGKSGGRKSDVTKAKIGQTTLQKWANPDTAAKMRNGLRKGIETIKERAKENFVDFTCPVCQRPFKMKQWETNGRKTCSLKCAAKLNYNTNKQHLQTLSELNHQKTLQQRNAIKDVVINWATNNQEIVLNCPFNKITTQLQPLMDIVQEQYNIKDLRSIMLCFDITSRKKFILYLQNFIKN